MYEETKRSKVVKYILIGIALLFVFVMLVLPLVTVICEAFKSGAEAVSYTHLTLPTKLEV